MAKRTPSGKFRGKVTIGYDPDGKPIYKYVTAPTRRELENVKEAVREHYIFGRAIPRDQPFTNTPGSGTGSKRSRSSPTPAAPITRRALSSTFSRSSACSI